MKFYRSSHEDRSDYREDELFLTIESLRSELLEIAQERSLSDHMVVELSQRLDGYIVMAQNKMMESLKSRQKEPVPYGAISKSKRVRSKSALQQ